MKKIRYYMMIIIVASFLPLTMFGGTITKVNVNGNKVLVREPVFIQNETMYIPLSMIKDNMDASVVEDKERKTMHIQKGNNQIECTINSCDADVNGETVALPAPPILKNGQCYVPVRFMIETLGGTIYLDTKHNILYIRYPLETTGSYDLFGRKIRTTNLPKNAKDFPYILEGVPNEMYTLKFRYQYNPGAVENKFYVRPVNTGVYPTLKQLYTKESLKLWRQLIENNLDDRLNVDYRTIKNKIVNREQEKSVGYSPTEYSYGEKKYADYIRENKIIIEGDYYVEPSMCYVSSMNRDSNYQPVYESSSVVEQYYMRCWVRFRATSEKLNHVKLYEKYAEEINTNTWYEGYVDIGIRLYEFKKGISPNNITIYQDYISFTEGVKPKFMGLADKKK